MPSLAYALAFTIVAAACGKSPSASAPDASADAASADTAAQVPRLRVSGSQILGPDDNPIQLRGYNWGEWRQWLPTDGADNVADGANVVRIPLRWWGQWRPDVDSYDPSPDNPTHLDGQHLTDLDTAIQQAASDHLWIVLFIDSNNGQGADSFGDNFFSGTATGQAMREEFKTVWTTIATRYKDQPWLGALEILPEPRPLNVQDPDIRAFYDEMIAAIRAVDTRTPIIVGGQDAYSPKTLEGAFPSSDPNVIFTADYFIFDPEQATPTDRNHYLTDFMSAHNVPVWINQVSINTGDGTDGFTPEKTSAGTLLQTFDAENIGWTWWTYREDTTNVTHHGVYIRDAQNNWIEKGDWRSFIATYF